MTEYIERGQNSQHIKKVYSINIVYFSLGSGTDTVYHGKTEFRGIHNGELLSLSPFQRKTFNVSEVSELYPEYYILKVNDFNKVAKTHLEEWIYYLNTGEVPVEATAPGLDIVRERLKLDRMTKGELEAYYRHLDNIVILKDNIYTEREEGRLEGLEEGREQGRAQGLEQGRAQGLEQGRAQGLEQGLEQGRTEACIQIARQMKRLGMSPEQIADATGLAVETVVKLV